MMMKKKKKKKKQKNKIQPSNPKNWNGFPGRGGRPWGLAPADTSATAATVSSASIDAIRWPHHSTTKKKNPR